MTKARAAVAKAATDEVVTKKKAKRPSKKMRVVQEDGVAEQTRERIIRVATALFYEHGYRGTSLGAIAKEVGISAPALYWHFSSKRELCFTAVHEELSRFVYSLTSATQEPTPAAQLGQFVRTYVLLKLRQNEWLREPGAAGTYRQLHQALSTAQKERINGLQRRVADLLRSILTAGHDAGVFRFADLTATSFAVVTLCEYVFAWVHPDGRLTPAAVADIYRDLALQMVGAKTATA